MFNKLKELHLRAVEEQKRTYLYSLGNQVAADGTLIIGGEKNTAKGANAYFENGANVGSRVTATRVVAGAVLLGPLGAVLGGIAKKDRNKLYVIVECADGTVLSTDLPAKDETKVREFVNKINACAKYFADADE